MVETIRWSPTAEASFHQVVAYLRANWSERDARNFVRKTDSTIRMLRLYPGMSRRGKKGTREALVTKHNLMCFRIKGNELQIVGFWDTRQYPGKRRITEV